jgi:hypothetical protein
LDLLENNPLDAFGARRVSPRSVVGPEFSHVEGTHELVELNILEGVGSGLVGGLSLQDGGHPGVLSTSDGSLSFAGSLSSLFVLNLSDSTSGRCRRVEEDGEVRS